MTTVTQATAPIRRFRWCYWLIRTGKSSEVHREFPKELATSLAVNLPSLLLDPGGAIGLEHACRVLVIWGMMRWSIAW